MAKIKNTYFNTIFVAAKIQLFNRQETLFIADFKLIHVKKALQNLIKLDD